MADSGLSLKEFSGLLNRDGGSQVVFAVGGVEIQKGYHVTKLKSANVSSIDCGREQAQWREVSVQLFDGPVLGNCGDETLSHMRASKLLSILERGLGAISDCADSDLYFEFSLNNGSMKKYSTGEVHTDGARTIVNLEPVFVRCDVVDRLRAPAAEAPTTEGCCGA